MTTIFRKEFKDIQRWIPLGILVIGVLCWQNMPGYAGGCYATSTAIAEGVVIGSSLFALALGLLQTLFDLRTESRAFLLHRPIASRQIFRGKLAAGFVAHTIAWSIPLMIAALYFESVGPERMPVSWANVLLAGVYSLVSFLFHPAGMWMACREARWVGTKCLPVVLPFAACVAATMLPEPWIWLTCLSLLAIGLLAWVIISAARHAFIHQTFLPPATSEESWSHANVLGLATASGIVAITALLFVAAMIMSRNVALPTTARRLTSSTAGQLWEIEETWKSPRTWEDEPIHRAGRPLTDANVSGEFVELDEDWREQPLASLIQYAAARTSFGLLGEYDATSSTVSKQNGGSVSLFGRSGQVLMYSNYKGWVGTITPKGIFKPHETPLGAFSHFRTLHSYGNNGSRFWMSIGGQRVIADDKGIYQIDVDGNEVRKLADVPTTAITLTPPSDHNSEAVLWARNDSAVHRFDVHPVTEDQTLPSIDSELVKASHQYPLTHIDLTPAGKWRTDWIDEPDDVPLSVASHDNGGVVMVTDGLAHVWKSCIGQEDGTLSDVAQHPYVMPQIPNATIPAYIFPPALMVGGAIAMSYVVVEPMANRGMDPTEWSWLLIGLHVLLGAVGAFLLSRRRVQSTSAILIWLIVGGLAGVSSWLAVIAIHPRQIQEQCTACQRRRRVDTDRCETCGAEWEVPDREGIEIIGPRDQSLAEVAPVSLSSRSR